MPGSQPTSRVVVPAGRIAFARGVAVLICTLVFLAPAVTVAQSLLDQLNQAAQQASGEAAPETEQRNKETRASAPANGNGNDAAALGPLTDVTIESLQARIEAIESSTTIDENRREALLERLQEAVRFLRIAQSSAAEAVQFEHLRDTAAEQLAMVREQLAEPMPRVDISGSLETPLAEVELELREAEGRFAAAQQQITDLAREQRHRTQRRSEVPRAIADARDRLQKINLELQALRSEEGAGNRAAVVALEAEREALQARTRALEVELASYDARRELLIARQDLAVRESLVQERRLEAWQRLVHQKRQADLRERRIEAERQSEQIAAEFPVLKDIVQQKKALLVRRVDVVGEIEEAQRAYDVLNRQLNDLISDHEDIRQRIEVAGLSEAVGLVLRKQRDDLPNLRRLLENANERSEKMRQIQLQLIEYSDQREELLDIDAEVAAYLDEVAGRFPPEQRGALEAALRELLLTQRQYLDQLRADLERYYSRLLDLDTTVQSLVQQARAIAEFIDERVLWIPSAPVLGQDDFSSGADAGKWLFGASNLKLAVKFIYRDALQHPLELVLALAALIGLIWLRVDASKRFDEFASVVRQPSEDRFRYTTAALVVTFATAAVWPGAMWLAGWRMARAPVELEFVDALGIGLQRTAWVGFTLEFVRQLCRPVGLGDVHFRWRRADLALLRRQANWLLPVMLPMLLLAATIMAHDEEAWKASLARMLFMITMAATTYALARLLWPSGNSILARMYRRQPNNTLVQLRYVWLVLLLGMPIGLISIAAAGYFYTAWQLSIRLFASFWLVLALVLAHGLVHRWLLMASRKLAIEQSRRKQEAEAVARAKEAEPHVVGEAPEVDEAKQPEMDVVTISDQTIRLMQTLLGVVLVLGLYFIWMPVLPALGLLDAVELWADPDFPDNPVTLASLALAVLVVAFTIVAAKNIPGLLEIIALQRLPLTPSSRYAIVTVSRYTIVAIGLVVAFTTLGLNWGKVQWLLAAVTVGLGFGLQEIFANFVSGLIIFSEQPIRVGDVVTIGNVSGTVTRIRIRATTILDWDRKELIVPNKEFVTGQLINWTLSDPVLRITVPVGIAYGSDLHLAEQTLKEVTRQVPNGMEDPPPQVWFVGFGDSSLNFEVRIFIPHIEYFLQVRHDLCNAIDAAFRERNIEISFPQRDLHIRSIDAILPLGRARGGEAAQLDGATIQPVDPGDAGGPGQSG